MERSCEGRGFSCESVLEHRAGISKKRFYSASWLSGWHWKNPEKNFRCGPLESKLLTLGNVTLSLRPDRIDRMEAGGSVVIDYIRAPAKTHWLGDKPQEPQLPLYTLLDEDIEGIAFGELSVSDLVKLVALSERYTLTNREAPPLEQADRRFVRLGSAHSTLKEVLGICGCSGRVPVDPTPTACQYCSLSSVCRIQHVDCADEPRGKQIMMAADQSARDQLSDPTRSFVFLLQRGSGKPNCSLSGCWLADTGAA